MTDAQVGDDITINHAATADMATSADTATNATNAANADTLDGNDSTAFASAGHGHNLQDLGGAVTDAQVGDDITINHAATATSADTATTATASDTSTTSSFATAAGSAAVAERVEKIVADFVVDTGAGSITAADVVSLLNNGKIRTGTQEQASQEYIFNDSFTSHMSIAALSDTKLIIAYRDGGNSDYGTAIIGEVTGLTVSFAGSSEVVFNSAETRYSSIAVLSSTKFVVTYWDGGNSEYGTAIIGDVSGSTISFAGSSEVVFNNADTIYISAAALSSTKFVVTYQDRGNSNNGTAIIGDVTGSTVSFAGSSEVIFNAAETVYVSVAALNNTKFVVTYRDNGNSEYGTAIIGDVTGSTITFGAEVVFNNASTVMGFVTALDDTKFSVAYLDRGNSDYGTVIVGDVANSAISFANHSEIVFNNMSTSDPSVFALCSSKVVIAYRYAGNSNYGTALVLSLEAEILGIAGESAVEGESVPVVLRGISDNHRGLTPGAYYYEDEDGSLTIVDTGRRIGLALSATRLLLDM